MDELKAKTTPKDFFLYLGVALSLYISAGALLSVLFQIIESFVGDVLFDNFYNGGLRFALAALIIIFPLYLFLTWMIRSSIQKDENKLHIWVRRWFVYLTLFIAGGTIGGDLVALVMSFLSGELATRFLLKVLVVLVVAAGIFAYYLYELKRENQSFKKSIMWVAILVVLASIVGGVMISGTPSEIRGARFDQDRIYDLQSIQSEAITFWQSKNALPETIDNLEENTVRGFVAPLDPETSDAYEYSKLGNLSFELCAVFSQANVSSEDNLAIRKPLYLEDPYAPSENWSHDAGRVCFERTIDPDFFSNTR